MKRTASNALDAAIAALAIEARGDIQHLVHVADVAVVAVGSTKGAEDPDSHAVATSARAVHGPAAVSTYGAEVSAPLADIVDACNIGGRDGSA